MRRIRQGAPQCFHGRQVSAPFLPCRAVLPCGMMTIFGHVNLPVAVVAILLSARVLGECHVGVARDVSGGVLRFSVQQALAAAENLSGEVSGIEVHVCVALHLCEGAAAIDVAIYIRCFLRVADK